MRSTNGINSIQINLLKMVPNVFLHKVMGMIEKICCSFIRKFVLIQIL